MKIVVSIAFFVFSIFLSHGQYLENPAYKVIAASSDSTLLVIQHKKKIGLYNTIERRFEVELGKNKFEYLKGADCFFELGAKQKLAIHVIIDSSYWLINAKNNEAFIHFPFPAYEAHIPEIVNINGVLVDKHSNLSSVFESNQPLNWRQIGVKKISENLLLINNYQNEVELHYFDGSDPIEYNNSGVFSVATDTWLIEPQYQQCIQLNNFVYCVRKKLIQEINLEQDIFRAEYAYSYDIYQISGENLELVYADVKAIDNEQATKLLGVDKAEMSSDKLHYIISKNQKNGLVRFQLFDEWMFQTAEFSYQVILPITADFIGFSPYHKKIGAIYLDSIQPVYLFQYVDGFADENDWRDEARLIWKADKSIEFCSANSYFYVNEQLRVDRQKKYTLQTYNNPITVDELAPEGAFRITYSIELINDSLVVNNNFNEDMPSNYAFSTVYGEDSLDFDGNLVFAPDEPGFEESGVYDMNNNNWFIQPNYQLVAATGPGFLLLEVVRDAKSNLIYNSFYSFFNFKNELIISRVKSDDIINNTDILKYMVIDFEVDSIFRAAVGFNNHSAMDTPETNYYFQVGNKMGVFAPMNLNGYFFVDWQTPAKEFIHTNPDVGYVFWLENDSLYLKTQHGIFSEKIQNLKLSYMQDMNDFSAHSIFIETDSIQTQYNVINNIDAPVAFSSFEVRDNLIIINDQHMSDLSCYECFDEYDGYYNLRFNFETENSVVWTKTNNVWKKATPYYAAINPVSNGTYIVSTGYYEKIIEHYEGMMQHNFGADVDIDNRYLLLDSNFKAMNFIDYFDFNLIQDLGFGYKICLDEGCFFMTYGFQILTDAVWDDFIPTDIKNEISAIRRTVYEFDEYGDFVYDENGNWKELVPEASEIIKLP